MLGKRKKVGLPSPRRSEGMQEKRKIFRPGFGMRKKQQPCEDLGHLEFVASAEAEEMAGAS